LQSTRAIVCYFRTIRWLEMVDLIVFSLSKRRKNGEQQAPRVGDEGYWNGWNADLIRRVSPASPRPLRRIVKVGIQRRLRLEAPTVRL
jgi:hypothetical protein